MTDKEKITAAVVARCRQLLETEINHPGLVIGRCNGTNKSSRKFFRKYFKDDPEKAKKINLCIGQLEEMGGFCNCEVIYNVVPQLQERKLL